MKNLMDIVQAPATELFASPLNCNPDPNHTYYSAFPEDKIFGARYDSFSVQWRGHCIANPEYEHEDMLNTMKQAITSAEASPQPFTCVVILPRWKDTPYRSQKILGHPRVKIITGIESHHFKFVPADEDITSTTKNKGAAKWAVDILLVSNQAGFDSIDWPMTHKQLTQTLRTVANSPDMHVNLFPPPASLHTLKSHKNKPHTIAAPKTYPDPLPVTARPTPPPLNPAEFHPTQTWPLQPVLPTLPQFAVNKTTPLTVIELCGGIGTGLEALLQAGYTIGSYSWADINPDGHTELQHVIPQLHAKYKDKFPLSASQGWDTRLPALII